MKFVITAMCHFSLPWFLLYEVPPNISLQAQNKMDTAFLPLVCLVPALS